VCGVFKRQHTQLTHLCCHVPSPPPPLQGINCQGGGTKQHAQQYVEWVGAQPEFQGGLTLLPWDGGEGLNYWPLTLSPS